MIIEDNDLTSIKDFKKKFKDQGGFISAVKYIKKTLGIEKKSFRSWKGLFDLYKKNISTDDFFVSEEAKIIFALTHLDTEKRAEILGIKPEMYSSLSESKRWYAKYASKLHPDRCTHPWATQATSQLNNIYERMKKYGE